MISLWFRQDRELIKPLWSINGLFYVESGLADLVYRTRFTGAMVTAEEAAFITSVVVYVIASLLTASRKPSTDHLYIVFGTDAPVAL